jgi:hypothetical protein
MKVFPCKPLTVDPGVQVFVLLKENHLAEIMKGMGRVLICKPNTNNHSLEVMF